MIRASLFAIALCLAVTPARAFTAQVLRCHDGDTCTLLVGQGTVKVRLAEIDAPESDQPYGPEAQAAVCRLVCGRTVEVDDWGLDRYGRTVGLIHAPEDVSEEMVREGMAWDYVRYNLDPAMPGLEAKARAGGLGLWSQPNPMPPWEWRHAKSP